MASINEEPMTEKAQSLHSPKLIDPCCKALAQISLRILPSGLAGTLAKRNVPLAFPPTHAPHHKRNRLCQLTRPQTEKRLSSHSAQRAETGHVVV